MDEKTLTRTVKEFGNGAHVTTPKEWVGHQVELNLQIPETPDVFDGLEQGAEITATLNSGGELHGCVEKITTEEYKNNITKYVVFCNLTQTNESYSKAINMNAEVDMQDVCAFELVMMKHPNELWGDVIEAQYYHGEFVEQVQDLTETVKDIQFTISRKV